MRVQLLFFTLIFLLLAAPLPAAPPTVLVVGDSLGAGYGIDIRKGWVQLLQNRLTQKGYPHKLVNASISGDTSASALSRLPHALKRHRPTVVIIEVGGNDGLQGLSAARMQTNLETMVALSKKQGARVLLLGMRLPPNYGPAYTEKFFKVYGRVARQQRVALVPFFLEGVAGNSQRMQADGIHPGEAGQGQILDNIWPVLQPLL